LAYARKTVDMEEITPYLLLLKQGRLPTSQFRSLLETNLHFAGVSGVEDSLQDDCKNTLEKLK
jgi:magnesium-transporting ATPase (P-type)